MSAHTFLLPDEKSTAMAARALAHLRLPLGSVIYLEGDLGAGKTTFVRAFLREKGFLGTVKSPTYTLVEPYTLREYALYHFDFYRMNHPSEFLEAGFVEYFTKEALCFVEWPEKAEGFLPNADIVLRIQILPKGAGRLFVPTCHHPTYLSFVEDLKEELSTRTHSLGFAP